MEVGWDYSNFKKNEKNVYFFMDTHSDMDIQDKILDESYSSIKDNKFDIFLTEGFNGNGRDIALIDAHDINFSEYMEKEHLLKKYFSDKKGYWSHATLLIARSCFSPPNFRVYGVDSNELMSEAKVILKNIYDLFSGSEDLDIERAKSLQLGLEVNMNKRSDSSVENTFEYLKTNDSVGMSFGQMHYKKMLEGFLREGVGVASYLPKNKDISLEEGFGYLEKLVRTF